MHCLNNINGHVSESTHIDEQIANHSNRMLNCFVDFDSRIPLILCIFDIDVIVAIRFTEIWFFKHRQHSLDFSEIAFDFL